MPGLANEMRPKNFAEYMGDDIKNTLTARMKNPETYPHTILLYGERGCGKTTAARLLAKEFQCLNKQQGLSDHACDECAACEMINENLIYGNIASEPESVCVTELNIATDSNKKAVEEALDRAIEAPTYPFRYKILILDECHMATVQAQNSLLKITEDPPDHLIMIFCTTDPEKMLSTLLDRCQLKLRVRKADARMMLDKMQKCCEEKKWKTSQKALRIIIKRCDRNPRQCWSALEDIALKSDGDVTLESVSDFYGGIDDNIYLKYIEAANEGLDSIVRFIQDFITDRDIEPRDFINQFNSFILNCVDIRYGINLDDYAPDFKASVKKFFDTYNQSEMDTLMQIVEYMNTQASMSDNSPERLKLLIINTALRIGKLQILSIGLQNEFNEGYKENKKGFKNAVALENAEKKVNIVSEEVSDDSLVSVFGKQVTEVEPGGKLELEVDDESESEDSWTDEELMSLLHK